MHWWPSASNWAGHSGRKRLETRCLPGGPADCFDWMRDDRAGHQCRRRRPPDDCARPGCFLCRCRVGGQHLCSLLRRTVAPRGFNRRSFGPAEGVSRRDRLVCPRFTAVRGRAERAGTLSGSRRSRSRGRVSTRACARDHWPCFAQRGRARTGLGDLGRNHGPHNGACADHRWRHRLRTRLALGLLCQRAGLRVFGRRCPSAHPGVARQRGAQPRPRGHHPLRGFHVRLDLGFDPRPSAGLAIGLRARGLCRRLRCIHRVSRG